MELAPELFTFFGKNFPSEKKEEPPRD